MIKGHVLMFPTEYLNRRLAQIMGIVPGLPSVKSAESVGVLRFG